MRRLRVDRVLESIPAQTRNDTVFRLASYRGDTEFMQDLGLDRASIAEITDLLQSCGMLDSLAELCASPFRPRRPHSKGRFPVTRFSDGSFAVFYCSTDHATAEAEAQHWFCTKYSGKPDGKRVGWYQCFTSDFSGSVKDLRPQQAAWPELTHDSDYRFCNQLGSDAKKAALDGLLAPSVRRRGGTNLPVFERSAISHPRNLRLVAVTCER